MLVLRVVAAVVSVSASCGSLPTLDMNALNVQSLSVALEQYGGFYLLNHGLPGPLQDAMFAHAAAFFDQPKEAKAAVHISHALDLRWNQAGSESTYGKTDTRETLYVAPSAVCNETRPQSLCGNYSELQRTAYNISAISSGIGTQLLRLISLSLNLPIRTLEDFFPDTPQPLLLTHSHVLPQRLSCSSQEGAERVDCEQQYNVGAHSDWGALTLLMLTSESHGLQMRCPSNHSQWIVVPPKEGALVVTAGDVMDTWTKGRYAASFHRVLHFDAKHRYAIPLFLDPKPELIIRALTDDLEEGLPFRERSLQGLSNAFLYLSSNELRGLIS